jgi:oxygen-independent coproporphyrinogen-3 oxidase
MAAWRDAGVTRLSIGVQSTSDSELVALGRDHRMGDGRAAVGAALGAGFASLSADVIAGAPGPGDGGVASARELAALGIPHLSVYELTLEPRAPLARAVERGEVAMRDADELADLYAAIHAELTGAGYEHYEISSYALAGHRAVHNSLYWQGVEYLGLGNGAASFWRAPDGSGERWTNARAVARYLAGEAPERDALTRDDLVDDRIWLGLRMVDGVEIAAFRDRDRLLEQLADDGLVAVGEGRVRPTWLGFLHADRVARRVVGS